MIDRSRATCTREAKEIGAEYNRRYKRKVTSEDTATIFEYRRRGGWKKLNFLRCMDVIDRQVASGERKDVPTCTELCGLLMTLMDEWDAYPENVGRESWTEGDGIWQSGIDGDPDRMGIDTAKVATFLGNGPQEVTHV